jgi:hypothetical protein
MLRRGEDSHSAEGAESIERFKLVFSPSILESKPIRADSISLATMIAESHPARPAQEGKRSNVCDLIIPPA